MTRTAIVFIAGLALSGCFFAEDEWRAFVYPNKHNLTIHEEVGTYGSLAECRDAALGWLEGRNALSRGDYECGLNCKPSPYGLNICEETER